MSNYFAFIVILTSGNLLVQAWPNPHNDVVRLPYGRHMRAVLSGRIPPLDGVKEDLRWWHALSRNNTIDCQCGTYRQSNETERWESENITELLEYPWSASLVAPGGKYAFCGGSLINDRYVLTSASCVDGATAQDLEVLIGTWPKSHYVRENEVPESVTNMHGVQRKKVHRVILHPKYSDLHLDYNIALLRLYGPVPTFGELGGISPVCLPEPGLNYDDAPATSLLWRFAQNDHGYIYPEKRSAVKSTILRSDDCRSRYNGHEGWEKMPDTMMCAEIDKLNIGTIYEDVYDCPGDAGGFLVTPHKDSGRLVQLGVDSWTACYGRPRGVGVYTRIQEFLPWIKLHIKEDGRTCAY